MTTSTPEPAGGTIAGDPRSIDVESTFDRDPDDHGAADLDDSDCGSAERDDSDRSGDGGIRPGVRDRLRTHVERSGDEVIGGVGAEISSALGVDALWVRLAFVVLALVGGVGVLLYAGLWLALVVGVDRPWARVTGGVIVIAGVPLYTSAAQASLATGTGAVLVLLVGMALALWNRRAPDVDGVRRERVGPSSPIDPDTTVENGVAVVNEPQRRRRNRRRREVRVRPPASPLGRVTLGAAVVIAAAGALIDESNGGRLHPEQWLGAAAIVCGVGLLVGTIRGRGRWLIVPASAFALAGFAGGGLARAGVPIEKLGSDSFTYIADGEVTDRFEPRSAFGATYVNIDSDPGPDVVEVDARAVSGDVNLSVADDVTVSVRTDIDGGSATVDGRAEGPVFTVGPDTEPDVIVDARVVRGDVIVTTFDAELRDSQLAPIPNVEVSEIFLSHGVLLRDDGFVFVDEGEGIIGPDNAPISGRFVDQGSEYLLETGFGPWRLLGNLLITPDNELIDLDRARQDAGIVRTSTSVASPDPANGAETVLVEGDPPIATTTVAVTVPPSTTPVPAPDNGQEADR